ncbi:hypothetical protein [Rhizobium sp. Root483D2]|uniref:hypothetical protein n=1 Tax=Rhizobium sp. Root483D2 TaxID=1736545 RepID=UPI00071458A4|nr:hypothetical protein [Rhizobium sp. Root483D2]KQY20770.1 hypothetical protein ASD32_04975 [Rhizobium sp. Root483D2]
MGMHRRFDKPSRVLLVVGPTLVQCVETAKHYGIERVASDSMRSVTDACRLRGWRAGTPFIAHDRESWSATKKGQDLDTVLGILVQQGRLRIAKARDLKEAGAVVSSEVAR